MVKSRDQTFKRIPLPNHSQTEEDIDIASGETEWTSMTTDGLLHQDTHWEEATYVQAKIQMGRTKWDDSSALRYYRLSRTLQRALNARQWRENRECAYVASYFPYVDNEALVP